jgi:hypothetical protein
MARMRYSALYLTPNLCSKIAINKNPAKLDHVNNAS